MNEYFLSTCNPLGERSEQYGQSYWAESPASQTPLKFNSMGKVNAGDTISYETMKPAKSKSSGKPYTQLYKVKVVKSDPRADERPDLPTAGNDSEKPITRAEFSELMEMVQEIRDELKGDV